MLTAFMATSVIARAIGAETRFSDYCEARMQEFDEKLDDPNFIDQLYNGQPVERDGQGRGPKLNEAPQGVPPHTR